MRKEKIDNPTNNQNWINPTGGLGDILMLSGVLKHCNLLNPSIKYNLVRRSLYTHMLKGHPCINKIGYPPINAKIISTNYWAKEKLGPGNQRAYQIIARIFNLTTPIQEKLFIPGSIKEDKVLSSFIPSNTKKIAIIAPISISPRKMMGLHRWKNIVDQLLTHDIFVVQVGGRNDTYIKGSYSLLGLTTPKQLIKLLPSADIILTVDNFVMHAAHLTQTPAIVFWGPTDPKIYGYPGQHHFIGDINQCKMRDNCLGPKYPNNYTIPCSFKETHCMNSINITTIIKKALNICYPNTKTTK